MKYIFRDNNLLSLGEIPIKNIQIAYYDMEKGGKCFDEYYITPEEFNAHELMYISTDEDENDVKKTKVFVHHMNGSIYELQLKKLTEQEIKERSIWK